MAPVNVDEHLRELAVEIDRLKVLYEQYFLGLEKQAPAVARREVEKRLALLAGQNIGNTALRFRYLGLLRRWKTHVERWDRVLREIEGGTFQPHVARARRRHEADAMSSARAVGGAAALPIVPPSGDIAPVPVRPSDPSLAPAQRSAVPGMNDGELRALHQRYVDALRAVGDGREVRYETMVASLTRQVPEILKKNQCDLVSFNVTVKEGKVVFRATPRRVLRPAGAPPAGDDDPAPGSR